MDRYVGAEENPPVNYPRLHPYRMFSTSEDDRLPNPMYTTVLENTPPWLSVEMSQKLLRAIDYISYKGLNKEEVVVFIPLHWVPREERIYYRDAKIFGVPMRLNEYASTAMVAYQVSDRFSRKEK